MATSFLDVCVEPQQDLKGHRVGEVRCKFLQAWLRRSGVVLRGGVMLLLALLVLAGYAGFRRGGGLAAFRIRGLAPLQAASWEPMAASGPDVSPAEWLRSKPAMLLVAYPEWRGVYSAAVAQGPVLSVHDLSVASRREALVDLLAAASGSLRVVVVHGIPPGSLDLARDLHARLPTMRVYFVYHGTASAPFHQYEAGLVDQLIQATQEGHVYAVGSVKVGFSSMFTAFGARAVFTVPNFPYVMPVLPTAKYSSLDGRVHIGILVSSDGFHKNVGTQFVAACSVPNAVIHITMLPQLEYARRCAAPVVVTGLLPHPQFLQELVRMDIVMYVSLTECYPMLVVEAMSLGIPAVVSRTHHILDSDDMLRSSLVVDEADNPGAILAKLLLAVEHKDELRLRLLALATCLRREAEFSWGAVLALNEKESRRLQLTEYADSLGGAQQSPQKGRPRLEMGFFSCSSSAAGAGGALSLTQPPLFPHPALAAGGATGAAASAQPAALTGARIAFITYELAPGNPGGAGVVISHTILELLRKGVGVTVLAHTSTEVLAAWTVHMASLGFPAGTTASALLIIHHVPTLTKEAALTAQECHPRNIFLLRSRIFALAARLAHQAVPFDALEVFEYAGAGYELLRSLREWLGSQKQGSRSDSSSEAGGPAPEPPLPYLPAATPILVRLHGSIQLISQAEEGVAVVHQQHTRLPCSLSDSDAEAAPLMHLMERYVLQAAHVLLPQSHAMQTVYELAYGLTSERMLVAQPPMVSILDSVAVSPDELSGGGFSSAPLGGDGSAFRLLVYGRVAKMKGAETVARAAPLLAALLPPHRKLHLIFAGLDWPHPTRHVPTSEVVRSLLPADFGGVVEFLGPVERGAALVELCRTVHGAVIASEFETFGLAAHELALLGVPLVISNIPAYAEFFTPANAYVFQAENATDLSLAGLRLFEHLLEGRRSAVHLAHPKYVDPVQPYARVLGMLRSGGGGAGAPGIPASTVDTRLVEAGISRLEPQCWPSSGCYEQWAGPFSG